MDMSRFYNIENEKPLDNLVEDGGLTAIFRTIGCVGDSLSSGEFESIDVDGERHWHDMFEYSWGQFMARTIGSTVYNFSRGGMSADCFMREFSRTKDCFNPTKACQAYIIALGVNDVTEMLKGDLQFGTMDDIKEDLRYNPKSFVGKYAAIIQRYKQIAPDAKFFFVTMPTSDCADQKRVELEDKHAEQLYKFAEYFSNSYVIDLRKYAPVNDAEYKKRFYMGGHLNPQGYWLTAKMIMSYIDYIIRHNMDDFRKVGFINTPFINVQYK